MLKLIKFLFISFICIFLLCSPVLSFDRSYLLNSKNISFLDKVYTSNLDNSYLNKAYAYGLDTNYFYQNYQKYELLKDSFISPIDVDKNLIYKRLYLSGQNYFKSGNYIRADSCFSRVAESSYILADYALYYLAQSNHRIGDYSSAIRYYDQYSIKYPKGYWNENVELEKANCLYKLGEFSKMEEVLKDFIKNYYYSELIPETMFQLSSCLEEQEKYNDAIESYYKIWLDWPLSEQATIAKNKFIQISETYDIEIRPADLNLLHNRTKKLMKGYLFDSALSDLLELEEKANLEGKNDLLSQLKLDIAICNFRLRRYKEAVSILSGLLNSSISSNLKKKVIFWLAKSHTYLGNSQSAIKYYLSLVESYPYSDLAPESLENIAKIYEGKNLNEEAMDIYERIITEYPYSVFARRALWNTGWIFYKRGKFSEALKKFDRLVKIGRNSSFYSKSLYWKSKNLEKLGEKDLAILAYRELLDNDSYDFYKTMAIAKLEKIDPDYIKNLKENSNYNEIKSISKAELKSDHLKKAKELFMLGFNYDAIGELEIVEDEEHNDKELMVEVGKLFFKTGDYYRAIKIAVNYLNDFLSDEPKGEAKNIWKSFYPRGYYNFVEKWADGENVNPFLIYSVMREESHFNPYALSISNARGLMQIIPSTGNWIAERIPYHNFHTEKMWDEETNIMMGSWYLRFLLDYFNEVEMLAAAGYNAGQGAVGKWVEKYDEKEADFFIENIPYEQTREYVKKVLRDYVIYHQIYSKEDLSISLLVDSFIK